MEQFQQSKKILFLNNMKDSHLPKQINSYLFQEEVLIEKASQRYTFGIYINDKGEKSFAKHYHGNKKSINYFFLKNELHAYKLMGDVLEQNPDISEKYPNVKIPKLLGYQEDNHNLTLLIEYCTGQNLTKVDQTQKLKIYKCIFDYLQCINSKLTKKDKTSIMQRSYLYWIFLYPFVALRASVAHISAWRTILKASKVFSSNALLLTKSKNLGIVHRDLGDDNIFLNNDKIIILDFQLMSIADPILDYATTYFSAWLENKIFAKKLLKVINKYFLENKISMNIFKVYTIYLAIYEITLKDNTKILSILDFLNNI
jgi:serine/threonine protein kinase